MTSTTEIFRTLTEYNHALYRKVWESIQSLSDEQFVQKIDYSRGSIRDQMVHVAAAETRWLYGLKGDPSRRSYQLNPADYPTRERAQALWESVARELEEHVAALDDESLERTLPGMRGPAWQVLAHLVNHGIDHRAQVLRALHDFGAPTFDQDLVRYLWRR